MDTRIKEVAICIPTISTKGLLLSKTNSVARESFAVGLGLKLIEIVKRKLTYGSKFLPLGREGKIFKKSFSTMDGERLLHASRCYLYTTAGAISGILFVSTQRVGFCSDRSLKAYSTTGKLVKFQYKVSIPLEKINGIEESMNLKKPSNKYVELVTVDNFNFWFLGFPDCKKTLECIRLRIGHDCLSD